MNYLMLTVGLLVGFVMGCVMWEVLIARPEHRAATWRQHRLENARGTWQRMWLLDIEQEPGVRVIDGKAMYSSDWLN